MISSYVKFTEFASEVAKQKVFCRLRFFQPSPQEAPMLPDVKVIGEMRFTSMIGSSVKVFLRQFLFKSDDPSNPEKEKFSIEFKVLCRILSQSMKCNLLVGEVGETILSGEIDDQSILQTVEELYKKTVEMKNQVAKAAEVATAGFVQPVPSPSPEVQPEAVQDVTGVSESVGAQLG